MAKQKYVKIVAIIGYRQKPVIHMRVRLLVDRNLTSQQILDLNEKDFQYLYILKDKDQIDKKFVNITPTRCSHLVYDPAKQKGGLRRVLVKAYINWLKGKLLT